jgi:glyoxalase family protein
MQLEGIHHVTCITGDAPGNVAFYTGVLGLRLVKKTVNQDDPRRGRAGAGMVHRVTFRVASEDALDFWEARLGEHGLRTAREQGRLRFEDPEGLGLELAVSDAPDAPLVARHPEIPEEHALQGFGSVRAFTADPERSRPLLEDVMGFRSTGDAAWELRGRERGGLYAYDPLPASSAGVPGAGTVHHVAWSSTMEDHAAWQRRVSEAGMHATPVIDRFWFRSVYFREPSGVLFELATLGPGFGIDEDPEHLGETLILPPAFEHLRPQVEKVLTPLPDPRVAWAR